MLSKKIEAFINVVDRSAILCCFAERNTTIRAPHEDFVAVFKFLVL